MFNYTKEVIINSNKVAGDATGKKVDRFIATTDNLNILRHGEYKKDNIVGAMIKKTAGTEGVQATATMTFTPVSATAYGTYQVGIFIGMDGKFLSDFAQANWYHFGKPIVVEYGVTATNNTAAAISQLVADSINEAVPATNKFAWAEADTATGTVTVTLTDPYAKIKAVALKYLQLESSYESTGEYVDSTAMTVVITDNVEPFATGEWLQENLRLPTETNLRYNAYLKDEYPIAGALYTMYSFAYQTTNLTGGVSAVGQVTSSNTRQVYYIKNEFASEFEAAITSAFGTDITIA